jgi:CHASE2 domain-containing sensor protein
MNFNTSVFEPALKFRWVIFCLLFGLSLSSVALKPSIDRLAIDLLHLTSDQRDESAEIIVVAIDEATLDAIDHPWPWPRQYYGEMLYRLEQLGINEAGFDLQFIGSLTSDGDAYFAEAIDQFGHVVLASDMVERSTNFFTGVMLMEPLPTLLDAGAVSGSVGVDREIDGVVRYPPTYRASFSEQLARGRNNSPPRAEISSGIE